MKFYKCTRSDGTDFYTGKVNYAEICGTGKKLVHPDPEGITGKTCGRGFHVSPTPKKTIKFGTLKYRPYRWWEVDVEDLDIIESDSEKTRVKSLSVVKEIALEDVFGPDFVKQIERTKEEAKTWKNMPWLKPNRKITEEEINDLFQQWRNSILPWVRAGNVIPNVLRIVTDSNDADAAANAAYTAAYTADDVANSAADAADAANASYDVYAAYACADAAADAAYATADAAANATANAAANADANADANWKYFWWYIRPDYVLWQCERWKLAGMTRPNLWVPLVAMFKLGCRPIGYSNNQFVVYVPEFKEKLNNG